MSTGGPGARRLVASATGARPRPRRASRSGSDSSASELTPRPAHLRPRPEPAQSPRGQSPRGDPPAPSDRSAGARSLCAPGAQALHARPRRLHPAGAPHPPAQGELKASETPSPQVGGSGDRVADEAGPQERVATSVFRVMRSVYFSPKCEGVFIVFFWLEASHEQQELVQSQARPGRQAGAGGGQAVATELTGLLVPCRGSRSRAADVQSLSLRERHLSFCPSLSEDQTRARGVEAGGEMASTHARGRNMNLGRRVPEQTLFLTGPSLQASARVHPDLPSECGPVLKAGLSVPGWLGVSAADARVLRGGLELNWSGLGASLLWRRHLGLRADGQNFKLENSAFWIFGGSIHYFRVPRAYWRDRLLKLRACGLNTLTTYVPWNLHEPQRGTFDFSGNLDLEAFILLAAEVGLWVILRPGPYICSEMDLGGLPSWLLRDPDMRLRTTYKGFTEAVDLYFDHLMLMVVPLQYKHGGPIIAVQVENEYGSYNKDPAYMPYIKKALQDRGIVELLLTSDNQDGLKNGIVDGVLATINLQSQSELRQLTAILLGTQGSRPKMVMEYWTGWFDSWGGPHYILDSSEVLNTVSAIVEAGSSINLYMFHGGTNFGFIGGAMHFQDYKPDVTSYDYDAVLTEAGDYTAKYTRLREFFGSMSGAPLPVPPALLPKTAYDPVTPAFYVSLWDALNLLELPVTSEHPVNMENLPINGGSGQSFGYTLYETTITSSGVLSAVVRDRGQVFLNTFFLGILDYKTATIIIPMVQGFTTLRILVENCGRVNYGDSIDQQRKGIIGNVYLNDSPLKKFKIYNLEMDRSFLRRFTGDMWKPVTEQPMFPAFFLGALYVSDPPYDTFMKLEGWEKGVVFINGQNLGRYWNIGPQETLYLPGAWLDAGLNKIMVFEEKRAQQIIQFVDTPSLGQHEYLH
ncbi:beta-galactosidase-1-like protein 2 [Dama dama]|uniref:beta-galactosidase-1-like protein 2 n=1 Tax=Dama dama TaxID=30532 RepID=UPI002A36AA01|nr:beta-galactosidase-1-like protein 2 [Dama dama]